MSNMTKADCALIDARTLYDILKARADDPKASRDDVIIADIALRNYNYVADHAVESSHDH